MNHVLKCHDIVKTNFVRAENCFLYDELGRRYTDFESGIWCTALGHSHPRISQVIVTQAAKLMHLGTRYPNTIVEEAALAVLKIVHFEAGKCVFLSSGSEAVEFGAQTIRRVIGKNILLTFSNSYLAAYGSAGQKNIEDWFLVDWNICPEADTCLENIPFDQVGGFVLEPGGSGSGFVRFPPLQLVQELVQKTRQAGGLVMSNEVTAGMGRTGKWFGFQHYEIQPDLVALGKGLGNGYPVSAVAMSRDVAEKLEASGLRYAQSHQNDPLGCSVTKEVIAVMRDENLIEKGAALGAYFLAGLQRCAEKYAIVREARGRGMLLGLDFNLHETFSAETAYRTLLEQGFLAGYYPAGNILRFDPALTMEQESVDQLLDCLDNVLQNVQIPTLA
jgi:acetylornithine aminotransferase